MFHNPSCMMFHNPSWMVAAIDGRDDTSQSAKTVAHCLQLMAEIRPFKRAVLFGNKNSHYPIEYVPIPRLSLTGYSLWCLRELWRHVTTDFVLLVQPDGYILNPGLWSEDFMDFDYVGAPWPHMHSKIYPVGNGGFSLRSRRFCEQTAKCPLPYNLEPEDVYCCQIMQATNSFDNIAFAPTDVAARFAVEWPINHTINENNVFGFHKCMNGGRRVELP